MMPHDPVERHGSLTAALATAVRLGNQEQADRLRTELRTAKLAARIKEATEAAPPLSEEQLDRLRGLLGAA